MITPLLRPNNQFFPKEAVHRVVYRTPPRCLRTHQRPGVQPPGVGVCEALLRVSRILSHARLVRGGSHISGRWVAPSLKRHSLQRARSQGTALRAGRSLAVSPPAPWTRRQALRGGLAPALLAERCVSVRIPRHRLAPDAGRVLPATLLQGATLGRVRTFLPCPRRAGAAAPQETAFYNAIEWPAWQALARQFRHFPS